MQHFPYPYSAEQLACLRNYQIGLLAATSRNNNPTLFTIDNILSPRPIGLQQSPPDVRPPPYSISHLTQLQRDYYGKVTFCVHWISSFFSSILRSSQARSFLKPSTLVNVWKSMFNIGYLPIYSIHSFIISIVDKKF